MVVIPESELRRTNRIVKKMNYNEDSSMNGSNSKQLRGGAVVKGKSASSSLALERGGKRQRTSAVYSVGGRVYDSEKGTTCHWCRQKTVETHVECHSYECQNEAPRPVQFCGMCLRNRHGEDIDLAVASGVWECPKCRKSCGEGCKSCCNCGPCRKKAGLSPTHQVIRIARDNGFDNVHDYLVWEKVGGTPESIKARKQTFKWGEWIYDKSICAACSPPSAEDEEADEEEGKGKEKGKGKEEDASAYSSDEEFKIVPSARIYAPANNIKF